MEIRDRKFMDSRVKRFAFIARIVISMFLIFQVVKVFAAPTTEQIQIFKSLSPAQQQKAMAAYNTQGTATRNVVKTSVVDVKPIIAPRNPVGDKKITKNAEKATENIPETADKKEKVTFEKIKQFGYDLFAGTPTTFAPATDIPVPLSYVIGPGDNVLIQLYGKQNITYDLNVNREGVLQFPSIGPMVVAGLSFSELQQLLKDTIDKQLIGVKASITLGALRSIRIFVLGEVERPGSYTISALSTMTNALFASGGIANIGSLRNIQLKRNGNVVTTMDLYDLLLSGDTSADQRLMPGDVIFVPPIGKTVGIAGEIRRPAIYEIKEEKTVAHIIDIAGGLLPTSYTKISTIERINNKNDRTFIDIELSAKSGFGTKIKDGDVIKVLSVLDKVEGVVLLSGHVRRELGVSWKKGLRVSDIIKNKKMILPRVDLKYALIERENQETKRKEIIHLNLNSMFNEKNGKYDIQLQKEDKIIVFELGRGRAEKVKGIIAELKSQATYGNHAKVVQILGNIKSPGEYPLHESMTLGDLIIAASDLLPKTDSGYVLVERLLPNKKGKEVIQLSIAANYLNEFLLEPEDKIIIFNLTSERQALLKELIANLESQSTLENAQRVVSIEGRVKFPGKYPYVADMNALKLVQAAGGYLDDVYLAEAEIHRYENLDGVQRKISKINVNLKEMANKTQLQPYDRILVRKIPNWSDNETIKIEGEVKFPGTYNILKSDTLWDIIQRAGGLTEYADPNAAVFSRKSLQEKEQRQLDRYKLQLDQMLASKQVSDSQSLDKELAINVDVLNATMAERITGTKAIGRLIVDLPRITSSNGEDGDVKLMNGDMLVVPRTRQEVSILGEVNFSTSHLFKKGYMIEDYISESGGLTAKADEDRIYVIKANGAVIASDSSAWFKQGIDDVSPGDTIIVPYDIDAVSPMIQWSNVSRILFQLATTAATLKTVGVF